MRRRHIVPDIVADRMQVSKITVGERHRKTLDAARVDALADSIAQVGLLQPIVVTHEGSLVAGRHRLEACRKLGLAWIDVNVVPEGTDALTVELAEIDENLVRAELTELERGEHNARRKEIYELLHPETKAGVAGARAKAVHNPSTATDNVSAAETASFAADTAAKTGQSERTVRRSTRVGSAITPEARDAIRETKTADNQAELLRLAALEQEQQLQAAQKIAAGEAKTVAEAVEQLAPEPAQASPDEPTGELPETLTLICGDWREELAKLPESSVDLIFTDPTPYRMAPETYGELARLAARALKPNGSLVCYAPNGSLPETLAAMGEHLTYWWTIAAHNGGSPERLSGKNVLAEWRPLVWFVRDGVREGGWVLPDFTKRGGQQEEAPAWSAIDRLTNSGETVLDPFLGAGTTLAVAHKLGRRAIGIDADEGSTNAAREHLATR